MKISEALQRAGYAEEMDKATEIGSAFGTDWRDRPNFRLRGGKLQYCEFRCLNSYCFGGSCGCVNHKPESWIDI